MNTSNTTAFTFLAWASFILAFCAEYVGIYNLQESLSVKGYYAVSGAFLIMSSFVLQKTIRDNQTETKKNTSAFTILSWVSFAVALVAQCIGIYYLEQPLSVQGYYAVTAAFLVMSSFVLQKVIRDNHEARLQDDMESKNMNKHEEEE